MTLEEVILKRKSIRKFKDQAVDIDTIFQLFELATKGPSAGGIRGYQLMVTTQPVISYKAPIYVVICIDPESYGPRYGNRGRELYAIQDATIAGAYFQLLLVDRGLSSCWVGAFNEERVKRILETKLRPIAVIAVGYEDTQL